MRTVSFQGRKREPGTNNCGSEDLSSEHTALGSLLRTVKSPHPAPNASGGQVFGLRSDFRDKGLLGQSVTSKTVAAGETG